MSSADHDRFQDDVGVYLLGALEDTERSDFERHVAICHVCHDELERLRGAADALPRSVDQYAPPPAVKRALMEHVYAEVGRPAKVRRQKLVERLGLTRPRVAIATPIVLLLGVLGGYGVSQLGGDGGAGGVRTISASVDGTRVGHGRAELIVPASGGPAHLRVSSMPQPRAGQVYEIWLKRGKQIEPGPLFSVDRNGNGAGAVPSNLTGVSQVMVTRENQGGAQQPTEAPVVSVKT
jgi:anti-sigma-K factor RskA